MNKFILTSDLHIKQGIFCQVGLDYLDYIDNYSTEHNINNIVFLGDLLDKSSKIHNDVFIPFFKKIEHMKDDGKIMWFILGNHDITSTITNSSLLETFERFGTLINSPDSFEFNGKTINMVPYTKDESLVPTVNADYLFTHLDISEFDFGNNKLADEHQSFPVNMFSNYKKVFTGHYHKRQEKYNIEYIGSPYQLTFGDAEDYNKGFVVFDSDTGNEEFIQYKNAPYFKKYRYDDLLSKIKDGVINKNELQNNLIKIVVDKKVDELSRLKSELYNNYGVVDIVNEFEANEIDTDIDNIKVDMNLTISEMLEEFISTAFSNIKINGYEITGNELIEKFREFKS